MEEQLRIQAVASKQAGKDVFLHEADPLRTPVSVCLYLFNHPLQEVAGLPYSLNQAGISGLWQPVHVSSSLTAQYGTSSSGF